jgi:hypothetical protein
MVDIFDNLFEDDAVELTASQDLETINPDDFKFYASYAFDYMSDRISKTPTQRIEILQQVKTEAWEKYNVASVKNKEKVVSIEAKINEYKLQIEATNTDIVQGIEKLKDPQLEILNARIIRVTKLLNTQKVARIEVMGEGRLLRWNYEDKIEDIDNQILKIESEKTIDFDLSEGAKSGCTDWVRRRIYPNYRSNTQTTAMKKGDAVESDSIDYLHTHVYKDYIRQQCNQERKENEFFIGRRDHVLSNPFFPEEDITIDTKNVSHQKFMLPIIIAKEIPDKRYWVQGQVYCANWGDKWFEIVYVLMNMPDYLIYLEAKKELGWDLDIASEKYKEFKTQFIYDSVPYYNRIKRFKFQRDDEYIKKMENKVLECRRYIRHLLNELIQHEANNCL